ncbi:hypothetical protein H6B07_18270 [Mediterraneibacter glycyrrhizinilyticus]|nr:hypothetical protein [Mediterraneibacter glycyrrhizinilyticus]MBM6804538.1 hypothetical protein [Mediterraneibacter glycyrrhizinilyticus]
MDIIKGKIVEMDNYEDEKRSYEIEQITAEFEEDIADVIGVVRCTGIIIESKAPLKINSQAETMLYNELADVEYNDVDSTREYEKKARKDISKRTGIDASQIIIERL